MTEWVGAVDFIGCLHFCIHNSVVKRDLKYKKNKENAINVLYHHNLVSNYFLIHCGIDNDKDNMVLVYRLF